MQAGQVVLFRFPHTDFTEGKLRPALLLARLPGEFDDWLICMISSQTRHFIPDFDEWLDSSMPDFATSGLKVTSIRAGRIAVIEATALAGIIGHISEDRLRRIRNHLARWLLDTDQRS